MSSKSIIYKHYLRVLSQWPLDPLRPQISFQNSMRQRIESHFNPPTIAPQDNVVANGALATVPSPVKFDEKVELEQVNVLYSFLESRYTKKYPLSDRIMRPASNPTYYEDLVKELEEAPQRSWFGSLVNRWKGFLRFS